MSDSADLSVLAAGKAKGATVVATDAPAIQVAPYAAAVRPGEEALAVK